MVCPGSILQKKELVDYLIFIFIRSLFWLSTTPIFAIWAYFLIQLAFIFQAFQVLAVFPALFLFLLLIIVSISFLWKIVSFASQRLPSLFPHNTKEGHLTQHDVFFLQVYSRLSTFSSSTCQQPFDGYYLFFCHFFRYWFLEISGNLNVLARVFSLKVSCFSPFLSLFFLPT